MTDKDTYTAQEVADVLGVKLWKVREMIRRGLLKHIHINPRSHHNARITREEMMRIRQGSN